jgi:rod shape-determining protein MreC
MTGSGLLRLQVFDVNAVLRPGEQLVTFGSVGGSSYVPGVPVGAITKVEGSASSLTKLALVRPYANDAALGVVGVVVVPPRHNPRFAVLPPAPTPAPKVTVTVTASPGANPSGAPSTPSPGATGTGG